MLKRIVIDLVSKHFGKYIKDLHADKLNISLWNGDVSLEELFINTDAFEDLIVGIPLKVKEGRIAQMSLHFPWSNLEGESVVVKIKEIELVCHLDYSVDISLINKQLKTSCK